MDQIIQGYLHKDFGMQNVTYYGAVLSIKAKG